MQDQKVNENETNKEIWSNAKLNLRNIVLESVLNGELEIIRKLY